MPRAQVKTPAGRRKSDVRTERLLYLFIALTLASTAFSIYIGYKAIRTMDATSAFAYDAYNLGKAISKSPKYEVGPEHE